MKQHHAYCRAHTVISVPDVFSFFAPVGATPIYSVNSRCAARGARRVRLASYQGRPASVLTPY